MPRRRQCAGAARRGFKPLQGHQTLLPTAVAHQPPCLGDGVALCLVAGQRRGAWREALARRESLSESRLHELYAARVGERPREGRCEHVIQVGLLVRVGKVGRRACPRRVWQVFDRLWVVGKARDASVELLQHPRRRVAAPHVLNVEDARVCKGVVRLEDEMVRLVEGLEDGVRIGKPNCKTPETRSSGSSDECWRGGRRAWRRGRAIGRELSSRVRRVPLRVLRVRSPASGCIARTCVAVEVEDVELVGDDEPLE